MPVYLIIRKSDGFVENAIKWNGDSNFDPGAEYDLETVSGEPGCPWIGWTRESNGTFTEPPTSTWAVVKTLDGSVIQVVIHTGEGQPNLDPAAQIEYSLVKCPSTVQPGWSWIGGEFIPPNNES